MNITNYGPGDSITWGPCYGHPLDPRTNSRAEAVEERMIGEVEAALKSFETFQRFDTDYELLCDEGLQRALYLCIADPRPETANRLFQAFEDFVRDLVDRRMTDEEEWR